MGPHPWQARTLMASYRSSWSRYSELVPRGNGSARFYTAREVEAVTTEPFTHSAWH